MPRRPSPRTLLPPSEAGAAPPSSACSTCSARRMPGCSAGWKPKVPSRSLSSSPCRSQPPPAQVPLWAGRASAEGPWVYPATRPERGLPPPMPQTTSSRFDPFLPPHLPEVLSDEDKLKMSKIKKKMRRKVGVWGWRQPQTLPPHPTPPLLPVLWGPGVVPVVTAESGLGSGGVADPGALDLAVLTASCSRCGGTLWCCPQGSVRGAGPDT